MSGVTPLLPHMSLRYEHGHSYLFLTLNTRLQYYDLLGFK